VYLPLSLRLSQSSQNANHMIEHVLVDTDNMMQSYHMPIPYPQGPVSEWLQNIHNTLDNGPFILCCEEWPVITVFWIIKPFVGELL